VRIPLPFNKLQLKQIERLKIVVDSCPYVCI